MLKNLKKIYHHKWFPRLFYKKPDGGKESGVTAYFLIEWKAVFSIAILRFSTDSRETYHTHAFNAYTWWLKGNVTEVIPMYDGLRGWEEKIDFKPSPKPKFTSRDHMHRVHAHETTFALTFRGPWLDYWYEWRLGGDPEWAILTHGRKLV